MARQMVLKSFMAILLSGFSPINHLPYFKLLSVIV